MTMQKTGFKDVFKESDRLSELDRYELTKVSQCPELDNLATLTARLCDTPVASINMVDADEVWTLASHGIEHAVVPRDESICRVTIDRNELLTIADLDQYPEFRGMIPEVDGNRVLFYAGIPLHTDRGLPIGTLCVMDYQPRELTPIQRENLELMSREVMARLELRLKNKQLCRRSNKMEEQAEQNALLLQEIHHRIKNNLAVVSGLLEMQAMESEHPEVRQVLEESQLRLQSIAKIHEKIYESDALSEVDLKAYATELVETISDTFSDEDQDFNYEVRGDAVHINMNKAVPCALIINELVTNAYKHAFPGRRQGNVAIDLEQNGGWMAVSVSDDGVGLPDDFSFENQASLGSSLIQTLLSQLEAELMVLKDDGTTIRFSFPLS